MNYIISTVDGTNGTSPGYPDPDPWRDHPPLSRPCGRTDPRCSDPVEGPTPGVLPGPSRITTLINIILFLLFFIFYFFLSAASLSELLLFKKNLLSSLIAAFFLYLNNITNLNFLLLLLIANLFSIIIFNRLISDSSSVFF